MQHIFLFEIDAGVDDHNRRAILPVFADDADDGRQTLLNNIVRHMAIDVLGMMAAGKELPFGFRQVGPPVDMNNAKSVRDWLTWFDAETWGDEYSFKGESSNIMAIYQSFTSAVTELCDGTLMWPQYTPEMHALLTEMANDDMWHITKPLLDCLAEKDPYDNGRYWELCLRHLVRCPHCHQTLSMTMELVEGIDASWFGVKLLNAVSDVLRCPPP